MKRTTLTILLLLNLLLAFAQSKPVTVMVSLTPPYTPFLNEYASSVSSRLQVTLIVNDSRMINYPVKLQMFVERPGAGIVMRTAEYAAIPPILLNGGSTEVLSGASLSQYFQAQNNVFTGFDQAQYLQTGRIPDGQYRIGFMVVDAQRSDVQLSNLTFSQPGWFLLNDPPQLNLPFNQAKLEVQDIQDVKLEWYPRHLGSMNSAFTTTYQVELFALRVPGMNPQQVALSLPPDYTTTTNQNYFRLSQDKFILEPGIEYAWRVKAMAADGFTLFQNKGYSEVFSFTYGSLCPTPKNTDADVKGTDAAEILWDYDQMHSSWEVRFRLKDDEDAIWHARQANNNSVLLSEILTPATAYEYQVKAICNNAVSEYSPIKSFNTDVFVPPVNFDCGKRDTAGQVTNFTPKLELKPGDIIYNGNFPVKLTKIEGGSGTFKGEGRMRIPMLANIQINMQFTGLKVNEENQVYGGEMVSIYNENSNFFIEDLSDYFGEGDQIGNVITGQDSAAIILTYEVSNPGDLDITVDGDNVTITGGGTTTYTDVEDTENGFTVVDSEGNLFSVDEDGNVTEIGTSGGNTSSSDYNDVASDYNQLDDELIVTFANNGKWAFDERKEEYANSMFDSEYEKIGDYYVPWKLVPLGKSDKIKALVTSGTVEDPTKLKFLTPTGTEFFAEYKNGEYLIEVTGAKERDGIELYAIYMPDENTKTSVGKLKIASYPRLDMKVSLIPMADFRIDGIISEDILNQIYNPYYIHWHITIEPQFTNTSWDAEGDGLQATGSEFYSMFTPEMRALNAAYKEERGIDEESLYLFVFPDGNSEGNLMGDMPLKSRFGYIFNAEGADAAKITQTVAHELGHGAFQLKHTFSDKYKIAQNTTNNLMDYKGGTELVKYQWDVVHDPQNKLFNWSQDEEEGQLTISENSNTIILEGSIPDIVYKYRNNSISNFGYVDIKGTYSFITPAGYPIKINNVEKVKFSINGGVLNFVSNGKYYFGITKGNTFRGYISEEAKDKIFFKYSEGTEETTFKISQKLFTDIDEQLFNNEKLKIGNIINNASENDILFSCIKTEIDGKYLDCILKVKWNNRLASESGNYTGDSPPFSIQQDADVIYIKGNQCDPKYENNNLDDGVGKTIFYFKLVELISTDKEVEDLTVFCNFLSASSTTPFYFADKTNPNNFTEFASSELCEYLYNNKIISLAQFDKLFVKYEARGLPFYSTVNLYEGLKPTYNDYSIDFTSLGLKEDIAKINSGQLTFMEYFKRVSEEIRKGSFEKYVYSFKDLAVRYGILNDYVAKYTSFDFGHDVIRTYLVGTENDGTARAVCDDEEYKQYQAQFGTNSAYFFSVNYVEEMTIADGAAQGNFMLQKFAFRKNLFTGRSGVKNGYRRYNLDNFTEIRIFKSKKKYPLNTDKLGKMAMDYRKKNNSWHDGNVVVFEYEDNYGNTKYLVQSTLPETKKHAERIAIETLESKGIPPKNVKKIYSELDICELDGGGYGTGGCKTMVFDKIGTDVEIRYSYEYPGFDNKTRPLRDQAIERRRADFENFKSKAENFKISDFDGDTPEGMTYAGNAVINVDDSFKGIYRVWADQLKDHIDFSIFGKSKDNQKLIDQDGLLGRGLGYSYLSEIDQITTLCMKFDVQVARNATGFDILAGRTMFKYSWNQFGGNSKIKRIVGDLTLDNRKKFNDYLKGIENPTHSDIEKAALSTNVGADAKSVGYTRVEFKSDDLVRNPNTGEYEKVRIYFWEE